MVPFGAGIPIINSTYLSPEHASELLMDPLEELLHGSAVSDEGAAEVIPRRRNVTNCCLHITRDPLNEVSGVLVLNIQHLLIDILY